MKKIQLTWSLDPSNINDLKAAILVQHDRIAQDHFMAYTDAVQRLPELPGVVTAKCMTNRMTHHIVFASKLDRDLLDQIEATVETLYKLVCESEELEPMRISWTYTDTIRARVKMDLADKPLTRKQLVEGTAKAELPKIILQQLVEAAQLTKRRVEAGELDKGDAWEFLHFLITQEVITS